MTPRGILGNKWWDEHRKAAYARHGYRCHACGTHKFDALYHRWLEGHELYHFDYERGQLTLRAVVALCHACHNYIHDGRMERLEAAGQYNKRKRQDILRRGEAILKAAGYREFKPDYESFHPDVDWQNWHIIIEGETYYSRFRSFEEWQNYFEWLNSNNLKDSDEAWKRWSQF